MAETPIDFDSIEQCPQDEENPFAQISRALIRDQTISPECRWLLIYLLSNKDGWRVQVQQVVNHLKGMVGRDKVYKIFDEAIEAGYMQRIETLVLGKKRYKYRVSRSPKFKKCLLFPEIQEAENQDTENQDAKGIASGKNTHIKDLPPLTPPCPTPPNPLSEWKRKKIHLDYKTEDIEEAVRRIAQKPQNSINDVESYLDKVLSSIILKKAISDSPEYKPPLVSDKVKGASGSYFEELDNKYFETKRKQKEAYDEKIRRMEFNRKLASEMNVPLCNIEEKGVRIYAEEWGGEYLLPYSDPQFKGILEANLKLRK